MATVGRKFEFLVGDAESEAGSYLDFVLTDDGWIVIQADTPEDYDSSGPLQLKEIDVPAHARAALADLHANRAQFSDRAFQQRLSAIAGSVSEEDEWVPDRS